MNSMLFNFWLSLQPIGVVLGDAEHEAREHVGGGPAADHHRMRRKDPPIFRHPKRLQTSKLPRSRQSL